ncbi:flavin containing amine oxidoreductase family protein [Asticcacaulis biprosthecium C19]|uniref:Flavin containing amine oxidoreductase family protein n=1 Tax=Asticcacaulis biprosthecium C19 TaxID=715226 RepID=F4QKF6_9CAUL|nr:FAD-dependent oxidoreductase [Asticcacaulis biprosthecium]EGF92108.1 flavin containing amine oxidoreductase family protein [Asticcacaulis biprosthecium C19]
MHDLIDSQSASRRAPLQPGARRRIAVVGSGIAGLSAAWHLHPHCDVTVFESSDQPGGHSHSVNVGTPQAPLWIDMGFIVFNAPCYPNLVALFDHLGVDHQLTDMSFGVSVDAGSLEYGSIGLKGLFAQRRNLFRPRFLSLLLDVVRFYREAPKDLAALAREGYRLGDYLRDRNYGRAFIDDHLLPQAAAIWSTSARQIMDYPFRAFIAFFENHGLLKITDRILWRSVVGGAQAYLQKLIAPFRDRIRTDSAIVAARRSGQGVVLTDVHGATHVFDEVVFATHADVTLKILSDASPDEQRTLGAFSYTANEVVLHTDAGFMPNRRGAWSAWNYRGERDAGNEQQLCVTYWMNLLQVLKTERNYFVTLNPTHAIDPDRIIKRITFEHPLFNAQAIAAQNDLAALQGGNRTWFCGAYFGSGFHEDGLQSGLAVAEAITGVARPWDVDWSKSRIRYNPWATADILEAAE